MMEDSVTGRIGHVMQALDMAFKQRAVLAEVITLLEERLVPLLRPRGPETKGTDADEQSVPLANQITEMSSGVKDSVLRLRDIMDRLEL